VTIAASLKSNGVTIDRAGALQHKGASRLHANVGKLRIMQE
jgi:hypothetical protein